MTSDYDRLAHLDQTNRATGEALNLGMPGDLADCATCHSRVMFGMPLDGDAGGWMHIRSVDPATLAPIRHGHPARPDLTTLEATG